MANDAAKVRALKSKLARISEEYVAVSWQLTLAEAEIEPGEDATAKAIIQAGRKRRGEIQ